jgi:hypothetical protein
MSGVLTLAVISIYTISTTHTYNKQAYRMVANAQILDSVVGEREEVNVLLDGIEHVRL